MSEATTTDTIRKQVTLHAPISRVWRAIADAREFGAWFGVDFDGAFVAGEALKGKIVPTKADAEVAAKQKPYEGMAFDFTVDRIEPERLISFRWHPFAIDPSVDYSGEPTTLIVFELEAISADETRLTITESGFDRIPLARRAKAFAANDHGWTMQAMLVTKYLDHVA